MSLSDTHNSKLLELRQRIDSQEIYPDYGVSSVSRIIRPSFDNFEMFVDDYCFYHKRVIMQRIEMIKEYRKIVSE